MEQSGNYFSIRIANKAGKIDLQQSRISQSDRKVSGIVGGSKKKIIANCNESDVRKETEKLVMRGNP